MSAALPILLAGLGGGAIALALREALASMPALAGYLEAAAATLARAGSEGIAPSEVERRRLGVVAGAALGLLAIVVAGAGPLAVIAAAGPGAAGSAVSRRQRRYRRGVEREIPAIAVAVADAVASGGSLRRALADVPIVLEGPAAVEMARVGADLDLGLPVRVAMQGLAERLGSERIDALVVATLSQQRAGGDLAGLLRRHAAAAAERGQAEADARSATAQARLTGGIVAAMPLAMIGLVEVLAPGFVGRMLADPLALILLTVAGSLQAAGFLAIRRLGRVGP